MSTFQSMNLCILSTTRIALEHDVRVLPYPDITAMPMFPSMNLSIASTTHVALDIWE